MTITVAHDDRVSRETSKSELRKEMLRALKRQKDQTRSEKSGIIKKMLFAREEYRRANLIVFYVSLPYEVKTRDMLNETLMDTAKRVGVPVLVRDERRMIASLVSSPDVELEKTIYGIYQPKAGSVVPINEQEIDLVIVPGLAFDRDGNRLGHGKGYYDSFLKRLPSRIPRIGLAFDFQILDSLPHTNSDIPVTSVLFA